MSTGNRTRGLPRPFVYVCVAIGVMAAAWGGLSILSLVSRHTETTSQTYAAGGPLQVTGQSGDVTVIAEDRDDVRVDARSKWSLAQPNVQLRRDGDRLLLAGDCGGFWGNLGPGDCSTSFEIYVPRDTEVDVQVSSGDLRVVGAAARTRLKSSSGDVEAEGVSGPLDLQTSSGDVDAIGFSGPEISARTSSGDVTVRSETVADRIAATTSSGDVTVAVPDAAYDVVSDTDSGDMDVQVRQDPDARNVIEARTNSGDVNVVRLDDAR